MKRVLCFVLAAIISLVALPVLGEEVTPAQAAMQYIDGINAYFQVLAQENGDEDTYTLTNNCILKMYQVSIALSVWFFTFSSGVRKW